MTQFSPWHDAIRRDVGSVLQKARGNFCATAVYLIFCFYPLDRGAADYQGRNYRLLSDREVGFENLSSHLLSYARVARFAFFFRGFSAIPISRSKNS